MTKDADGHDEDFECCTRLTEGEEVGILSPRDSKIAEMEENGWEYLGDDSDGFGIFTRNWKDKPVSADWLG